jgi:hypothetical protein
MSRTEASIPIVGAAAACALNDHISARTLVLEGDPDTFDPFGRSVSSLNSRAPQDGTRRMILRGKRGLVRELEVPALDC